jgi:hypothetical protein
MVITQLLFLVLLHITGNLPSFQRNFTESMYLNIENHIKINLNQCNPEELTLKVTQGSLYKRDDSTYIFLPQADTEELKIKLYYKKVLLEVKSVTIKKLPDLLPVFEGETQGYLKIMSLDKIGKLFFRVPDEYPEDMRPVIVSFNIYVTENNGMSVYSATVRGDRLDDNALKTIRTLKNGARITINNVVTQNPRTGQTRLQVSREIAIVE